MSDDQQEEELSEISRTPPIEDLKYHYSPVPSDCMACAARATSRKRKELEAQKSDIVCAPFPSSEDVCSLPEALLREEIRRAQLHVVNTNKRIKVFGKWTEEKLLTVVTDRLLQKAKTAPPHYYEKIPRVEIEPISMDVPYDPIIHRGIFSESILRKLYNSGATESVLIRAMKFGLRHLKPEDLNYFLQFGVSLPILKSRNLWRDSIDESLTTSLATMGFDERTSRKIILAGMLAQNEICLMQMMLAGVDVPSILNWQGSTIEVGNRMTQFLRKLGVKEDVLQLVVQKGIDEETNEMLKDLGYVETEEKDHPGMHEVIVCECDLTILESEILSRLSQTCNKNSSATLVLETDYSNEDIEAEQTCACFPSWSSLMQSSLRASDQSLVTCKGVRSAQISLTSSELLVERIEYLRRTVMIPLAWAMAKALEYRPSDPKNYIACQLVRWRHGGVSQSEMKKTEDFVIARTIEMDKKLMEQKGKDEEELMAKREEEVLQNIPCHPCWEQQQIHHVKERCWKCIRKWVPNNEACEFPEICSSCKVDLSDIINSDSSTSSGGNFTNVLEGDKSLSKNYENFVLTHQNSYTENMESPSYSREEEYNVYEESFKLGSYGNKITLSTGPNSDTKL